MVFLPSSPTKIFSVRKAGAVQLPLKSNKGVVEPSTETNRSQTSSLGDNAAIDESLFTSSTARNTEASTGARENSNVVLKAAEILPQSTYQPPLMSKLPDFSLEGSPVEEYRPIVGRASSVRVSKPQLIENWPSSKDRGYRSQSVVRQHSRSDSHPSIEVEKEVEVNVNTLPVMPEEKEIGVTNGSLPSHIGPDQLNPVISKVDPNFQDLQPFQSPLSSLTNSGTKQHDEMDFAHPRTNKSHQDEPVSASLGEGRQSLPSNASDNVQTPVKAQVEVPQDLRRASTLPLHITRSLSRRVTIRPTDLIIKHNEGPSSFRESIVTTPYPPRRASDQTSIVFDPKKQEGNSRLSNSNAKDRTGEIKGVSKLISANGLTKPYESWQIRGAKDRFPSPERPEVLFVNLSLFNHPAARTMMEIQISDKSSFDDELLFQQICTAYSHQLLGLPRLLLTLIRKAGNACIATTAHDSPDDFDNVGFIRHFYNPKLGRKRKAWVIWLRNNNPRSHIPTTAIPASALLRQAQADKAGSSLSKPIRKLSSLKALSPLTRHLPSSNSVSANHSRHSSHNESVLSDRDVKPVDASRRLSAVSDASSYHFIYSPAMPRIPFLSSRHDNEPILTQLASPLTASGPNSLSSPCRTYFRPSSASSSMSRCGVAGSKRDSESEVQIVTISFQHHYRVGMISLLTMLTVLLATVVTIVWVIFGVPGTRPEVQGNSVVGDHGSVGGAQMWEVDAKKRVLTGVVIGIVTLLVGGISEGAVIWAARELL